VAFLLVGFLAPIGVGSQAQASALSLSFEAPSDAHVVLGDLASRTQRKPITIGGSSAPYTITGTDSRGGTYQYFSDVTTGTSRESDERGFGSFSFDSTASTSFTDSLSESRSGVMYLRSNGNCNGGNTFGGITTYCAVFGPEVWTNDFDAIAGQALSFDYAARASDNYEVYAFLVKVSETAPGSGSYDYGGGKAENSTDPLDTHTLILHRRGKVANWTTASGSVPETGKYRFRFVDGAYDNTGGYALGTDFYIDPTSVTVGTGQVITFANPGDQIGAGSTFELTASSSSGQTVTFSSATTSKCTVSGTTVTKAATGVCTITADAAGGTISGTEYVAASSVTRSFSILAAATSPVNSGVPTVFGSPAAGTTLTIDEGTWNTGGAEILETSYQWISTSSGVDTDVSGGTSSTLCVPENLVGSTLKVRVTKRNSVGSSSATSSSTSVVSEGTVCAGSGGVTPASPSGSPSPSPAGQAQLPELQVPPPSNTGTVNPPVQRIEPQDGPVLRGGVLPVPPKAPTILLGGRSTAFTTEVPTSNKLDMSAGNLRLGVTVLEEQGEISRESDGSTQIDVKKGSFASFSGTGFRPAATVQVFLPMNGRNAKELARIPVAADGSFDGSAGFATRPNESPIPIGKQVLQLVSVDGAGNQVVVEMTVNVAQGVPAPEANRIEGVIPTMRPGQAIATSGGEPIPVTITPLIDQKLAVVEGDGWSMAVNLNSSEGGVEPADSGALLKLVRNETAMVSGSGFMPGTRADVWMFSDPTLLGTVTIDENGEFVGEVNIDPNMIPVGEHTLQLQGVGEDGYVKAANMGVVVDDPVDSAADTAAASLTFLWWIIAAVMVFLVLAVILVNLRRRQA